MKQTPQNEMKQTLETPPNDILWNIAQFLDIEDIENLMEANITDNGIFENTLEQKKQEKAEEERKTGIRKKLIGNMHKVFMYDFAYTLHDDVPFEFTMSTRVFNEHCIQITPRGRQYYIVEKDIKHTYETEMDYLIRNSKRRMILAERVKRKQGISKQTETDTLNAIPLIFAK